MNKIMTILLLISYFLSCALVRNEYCWVSMSILGLFVGYASGRLWRRE